jgi:hypothetical protein
MGEPEKFVFRVREVTISQQAAWFSELSLRAP